MSKFSAPDIIDRSPGPVAGLSFGQESIVSAGVIEGAEDIGLFQPAPLDAEAVLHRTEPPVLGGWLWFLGWLTTRLIRAIGP